MAGSLSHNSQCSTQSLRRDRAQRLGKPCQPLFPPNSHAERSRHSNQLPPLYVTSGEHSFLGPENPDAAAQHGVEPG